MSDDRAHRNLACAVIGRAVSDADAKLYLGDTDIIKANGQRRTVMCIDGRVLRAMEWLTVPSDDLSFWCVRAEVPMSTLVDTMRKRHSRSLGLLDANAERLNVVRSMPKSAAA